MRKIVKTFENFNQINENDNKHDYMMLSRLQQDCDYFLGHGNGSVRTLYYDTIEEHIAEMKKLWEKLPEKPEWLSMEDIEKYEQDMLDYNENNESVNEPISISNNLEKEINELIKKIKKGEGIDKRSLKDNTDGEILAQILKPIIQSAATKTSDARGFWDEFKLG